MISFPHFVSHIAELWEVGMQKHGLLAVVALALTVTVSGCAEAKLVTVEVTREVKVPQTVEVPLTVEVTREVTRIVEQTVMETVEVVVTATPTLPPPPPGTPESLEIAERALLGTNLVGTDIEPGIYVGFAGESTLDTCYWERLSSL
jgi:hypothetical protein